MMMNDDDNDYTDENMIVNSDCDVTVDDYDGDDHNG
jgi:hypothetical protein